MDALDRKQGSKDDSSQLFQRLEEIKRDLASIESDLDRRLSRVKKARRIIEANLAIDERPPIEVDDCSQLEDLSICLRQKR